MDQVAGGVTSILACRGVWRVPNAFVEFLTDTGRITQDQAGNLEVTREQVDRLLDVQRFSGHAAVLESVAFSGQLGTEEAAERFGEFLRLQPARCGAGG